MFKRLWYEDEGVLTFEWIMLTSLVVAGSVWGMYGVRNKLNQEMAGVTTAMSAALHPNGSTPNNYTTENAIGWIDQQGTAHYFAPQANSTAPIPPTGLAGIQ